MRKEGTFAPLVGKNVSDAIALRPNVDEAHTKWYNGQGEGVLGARSTNRWVSQRVDALATIVAVLIE